MPTASNAEITEYALAARTGDREAADSFVRLTQARLLRYVAILVGPGDADDVTQDTYIRAMRALPSFEGRSSAWTWLLAIARHTAADHIRTLTRRPRVADVEDWVEVASSRHHRRFDDHHAVWDLVAALTPPERREAFVLTQVFGLSYEEAAQVCECPVGTIRSRVARAREDLVAQLTETQPVRRLRAV
ncbi:sigma-70 family RNA polymerase sigma factor [Hamadaea tsunoensis]|uniref:sigma-70 family RNA polymerase sigma factor n=1 Tax=Hamadaea tsunoensis TaxID=53368 RepID=UPI000486F6E3|nr:sigma-70 family RNA polymerase sigma factor [Hamadaea tsunoensis]